MRDPMNYALKNCLDKVQVVVIQPQAARGRDRGFVPETSYI